MLAATVLSPLRGKSWAVIRDADHGAGNLAGKVAIDGSGRGTVSGKIAHDAGGQDFAVRPDRHGRNRALALASQILR